MNPGSAAHVASATGVFAVQGTADVAVLMDGDVLTWRLDGERTATRVVAVEPAASGALPARLEVRGENGARLLVPANPRLDDATLRMPAGQELPLRRWLDWRTQRLVDMGRATLTLPPSLALGRGLPSLGVQIEAADFGSLRRTVLDVGSPLLVRFLMPPGGVSGGVLLRSSAALDLAQPEAWRFPEALTRGPRRELTFGGRTWALGVAVSEQRGPLGMATTTVAHVIAALPVSADLSLRYELSERADPADPLGTVPRSVVALLAATSAS